jgi:protein SCO1/2
VLAGACERDHPFAGAVVEPPRRAPNIVGTNWDGQPFQLDQHAGQLRLVFFGYLSCPDVCPTTFSKLAKLRRRLGKRAEATTAVFVSVDPARDSVSKLAQYVPAFDPRFFGVHLTAPALAAVTAAYQVVVKRHQPPTSGAHYSVDHTGSVFVIDRRGDLRLTFADDADLDAMAVDVQRLLDEPGSAS